MIFPAAQTNQRFRPIPRQVQKSGTAATSGPQYLELFQPFKGQIELGFSNVMAQLLWLDCIEQVQVHLKRIDMQKAELGGSEGSASATDSAQACAPHPSLVMLLTSVLMCYVHHFVYFCSELL